MKKKNGFIATSLIYSFFLIFITLFLSVIADYLQQKVLLNSIEKGIKDDINTTMTIKDFEVGSLIYFQSDKFSEVDGHPWIIANVDYTEKELVLYSYDLYDTSNNSLTKTQIASDIDSNYMNSTYIYKILYNFNIENGSKKQYYLEENSIVSKDDLTNCTTEDISQFNLINNCITSNGSSNNYRKRVELNIGDQILTKTSKTEDGSITITGVQT